jgi:hypothetical protein
MMVVENPSQCQSPAARHAAHELFIQPYEQGASSSTFSAKGRIAKILYDDSIPIGIVEVRMIMRPSYCAQSVDRTSTSRKSCQKRFLAFS